MAVGATIGSDQINNIITSLAVAMRDVMENVHHLDLSVNGQGKGLEYLMSTGFSGSPNPANPGGVSDADLALSTISYLNTVAQVYFGAAAQADPYNFNQQLSSVWAGQVA